MLWSKNCFLPLGRKKFCEKFSQWRERKEEEGRPSNDNQSVRPFRCSQVFNFLKMNFFFISNISLFFGANLPIPIDTSHIILPTMAPGLNSCWGLHRGAQYLTGYEALHLPNCKSNLISVLRAQSQLFWHFKNTTAYHWSRHEHSTKELTDYIYALGRFLVKIVCLSWKEWTAEKRNI